MRRRRKGSAPIPAGKPSSRPTSPNGHSGSKPPTTPAATRTAATVREYSSDALIVATGASARWLGIEGPFRGEGVSTCATCDGALYRGKEIAVVGGGDSAVEEATFLTRFASKVTLIHRRDQLRASKIMQDRLNANQKIAYAWNSEVVERRGRDRARPASSQGSCSETPQTRKNPSVDDRRPVPGDRPRAQHQGLRGPARPHLRGIPLDAVGDGLENHDAPASIQIDQFPNYGSATSVEGVFGCGDVVDTHYRQAITAAGSGCSAAMDCEKWLEHGGLFTLSQNPEAASLPRDRTALTRRAYPGIGP